MTGSTPGPGRLIDPADFEDLRARLDRLERNGAGSGSPPPQPGSSPGGGDRYRPYTILDKTLVVADQWEYDVAPTMPGGTSFTGRERIEGITYKARNAWEELPKAGYESSGVSGLKPIPVGAAIDAYWSIRDGKPILLFSERNEPGCD